MSSAQRKNAELLKELGRPAEVIAVNAELPLEVVKAWLKSGRWPAVDRQQTLFDMAGDQPRETRKPVTTLQGGHGLQLFASDPTGKPVTNGHPGRSMQHA